MKKLSFVLMLLVSFGALAAAQMWCLIGTTQCSYGTPSLSKLNQEERNASLYKMTVSKYVEAVQSGTFEAITANELIKRAKAYLAAQVPTDPEPEPEIPADTPIDMSTLRECAIKGGDGCWFGTKKERTFYLISGNQWEQVKTSGWGIGCSIGNGSDFDSTDISPNDAFSCFVKLEEQVGQQNPTEAECVAQGKVLNTEGTNCVDAPPKEEQMPPSTPDNYMPAVDLSKLPERGIGSDTLDIRQASNSPAEQPAAGTENGGQVRISCRYSHTLNDDPIVYPNQDGASHSHDFFGNTLTNSKSNTESLRTTGASTCNGGIANRSAYWTSSLIDLITHAPIRPIESVFYYKTDKPDTVINPPRGLRMIAGLASAQQEQSGWREIIRYTCNEKYVGRQASIPQCYGKLTKMVVFPSCWDGINLDSPDHKAHMAYSDNGVCPSTHPKQIPDITVNVHYQVNGTDNLRLASDNYLGGRGGYSGHADWWNGWNEDVLNVIVNNCLKARKDCHANLLGNGQILYDKFGRWETGAVREPLKQ